MWKKSPVQKVPPNCWFIQQTFDIQYAILRAFRTEKTYGRNRTLDSFKQVVCAVNVQKQMIVVV